MIDHRMVADPRATTKLIGIAIFAGLNAFGPIGTPRASELNALPVPTITIYPGDVIKDGWLADRDTAMTSPARGNFVASRDVVVGKIARRTLLPGAPIPLNAVSDPKIVSNGAKVRIVFEEGGLTIVTYGAALQDGGVGELISARNLETGITISGIVQSDGSIRLSGG